MEDLKAMYRILRLNGMNRPAFPPLKPEKEKNSPKNTFYQLLHETPKPDRDNFKQELGYTDGNDTGFRNFLHLRRMELINSLQHINLENSSPAIQQKELCKKYLNAGEFITNKGGGSRSTPLIKKAYHIAKQMDFTIEKLKALQFLMIHYFEIKQYQKWEETHQELIETNTLLLKENQIKKIYYDLVIVLDEHLWGDEKFLRKCKNLVQQARNIKRGYTSFNLELKWLDIRIITLELQGNFKKALEYSKQGRTYFENHPQQTSTVPGGFLIQELEYHLLLRDYRAGLQKSKAIQQYFRKNTQNRLIGYQLVILFYLHRMNAKEAQSAYLDIHEELLHNTSMSRGNQEKMLMVRGYLCWLIRHDLNKENRKPAAKEAQIIESYEKEKQDIGFLSLTKDKQGANIALQVLEFLELYEAGQTDLLLNTYSKWRSYAYRHLKDHPTTQRSYHFYRIMEMLINHHFTNEGFRKARPLVKEIRKARYRFFGPQTLQEVIPYEQLFETMESD